MGTGVGVLVGEQVGGQIQEFTAHNCTVMTFIDLILPFLLFGITQD